MFVCLSVCTEGSRNPLNQYSSPLQFFMGTRFKTILREGTTTLTRDITPRKSKIKNIGSELNSPNPQVPLEASRGVVAGLKYRTAFYFIS